MHSDNFSTQEYQNLAFDPELSCPSKINGGGSGTGGREELLATKSSEQNLYQSSLTTLNNLLDGGSTAQMEGTVAMANDQNAWNAYVKLMNEQGYLSDEVLSGVSEKETGFSKAMIRNVLVANPASAKSAEVQQKLDERLDPLPDYMRYQIDQGLYQISPREAMERVVSAHQSKRNRAIARGIRLVMADTTITAAEKKNRMIEFLQNTGNRYYELRMAMLYDRFGETLQADNIYNQLLSQEPGSAFGQQLSQYLELRELINSWASVHNLQDNQLDQLYNFSMQGPLAASLARRLLLLNGVKPEPEDIASPEEMGAKSGGKENKERKWDLSVDQTGMSVFPNPAKSYVTLRYAIIEPFDNLLLVVMDLNGHVVYSSNLEFDRDEVIIPLDNMPAGSYYVQLLRDGKTVKTEKFTTIE